MDNNMPVDAVQRRDVEEARIDGIRRGLDEVRGWMQHMRVGQRTAGWLAALDEMEIHVEAAWSRLDSGEWITGTSGFGLSDGGGQ